MPARLPRLPQLLKRKIYKTGQTRGADDDDIYQNRVGRNSIVLIPYQFWNTATLLPEGETQFENGFIVLIKPEIYFGSKDITSVLAAQSLTLGKNCLVFYEARHDWEAYNPDTLGWREARQRLNPLGGQYVARIPATTAANGGAKIVRGYTTTSLKGAGIRLYEYANTATIQKCRLQLEVIYWLCADSVLVASRNGMTKSDAEFRKMAILKECKQLGLLDYSKLCTTRMINKDYQTVCPLCLERLSGVGFVTRMAQAEGREVTDITVTEINLFHINELRYGAYNHMPYNLSWGHHHCNTVTKDSGITKTLEWMKSILERNQECGFKI
ncbi:MAG: BstXI family restriction endonuclease [Syntrophobacteraceae bacterium]